MHKYLAILLMLIIGVTGYNIYSYEKEKEEREKAQKNKPKVTNFKKDFNAIFFGSQKEPEKKEPLKKAKEIKTLNPSQKRSPGVRTLTNRDIEKLNHNSKQNRKMITGEDIRKLKEKDPESFEKKVEVKKVKKEKPEKKLSPLEKIIDSAKKSFSENSDDDTDK